MPAVGDKAPAFTLLNDKGEKVSLKDFKGKTVVLYFYPKDDTSGCTAEACAFRDTRPAYTRAGAVIVGVSPDSVASHVKFKAKYDLPFMLLSDESKEMLTAYGVWQEKSLYGRKYMGVVRTTMVIGPDGRVERIYEKVKVAGHADAVLKDIKG